MMIPSESVGYNDVMMMPGESTGGNDVMMIPGESGGYNDVMMMPHEFGGYVDVLMMHGYSRRGNAAMMIPYVLYLDILMDWSFGVLSSGMGYRDEFFVVFLCVYFLAVWDVMCFADVILNNMPKCATNITKHSPGYLHGSSQSSKDTVKCHKSVAEVVLLDDTPSDEGELKKNLPSQFTNFHHAKRQEVDYFSKVSKKVNLIDKLTKSQERSSYLKHHRIEIDASISKLKESPEKAKMNKRATEEQEINLKNEISPFEDALEALGAESLISKKDMVDFLTTQAEASLADYKQKIISLGM
ncbi:hypothetical protein FXO38_23650 [Capsicum annuum]|nr:hypothetical protein FXO38_23650 [Capsicum annuum]KAF3652986.1 hypothetical protein FXO37_17220 [Capsicum annuum]